MGQERKKSLVTFIKNKITGRPTNHETSLEVPENRVLILGSNISGALILGKALESHLEQRNVPKFNIQIQRDAGKIEEAVLGRSTLSEGRKSPNLPKGIILLPQMLQSEGLNDMPINSQTSGINRYVAGLCAKHGIPLVEIRNYESEEQIKEGLKQIFLPAS